MPERSRVAEYVPTVLILVGFGLIAFGWSGAAGLDYTQGQIPYLISGGLLGLGFIFYGCTTLIARAIRVAQKQQGTQLVEIAELLRIPVRSSGPDALPDDDLVVAGATSFHREDCRLASGRGTSQISREEALSKGLEPCRICEP